LIPLALKGVAYRAIGAGALLQRNLMIYGVGGIIIPFIGIKAIDLVVAALHLANTVTARSEATKQSNLLAASWIASLRSQ